MLRSRSWGFCEACALGKSHKLSFPKAKHFTKEILEYVHTDLWGSPSTTLSLAGAKYFITFIDYFTKKVLIYFLKTKDEALPKFSEWKTLVENQTGKRLKCLRSENGLEFCNQKFDKLCSETGVKRHKTCPYTPQQNGVVERMNRSIMDKVRSMLTETGLGAEFWAEAASTAVYIINRSPNSSIKFEVPEVRWTSGTIDYSHLRSFGCVAYVHTISDKISPRASKGIFLGYGQETKGFRIWLLEDQRVVISKDVVFHEDCLYKDVEPAVASETSKVDNKGKRKVNFSEDLEQFEKDQKDLTREASD